MVTQRRIDPRAQSAIERAAWENIRNPADIERRLIEEGIEARLRPSTRTIRRIVDEFVAREGEPWELADPGVTPPVAQIALEAMAAVTVESDGRRRRVTRKEVSWLSLLRPTLPELPPLTVYFIAREYIAREHAHQSSTDIDELLAFAPWRSRDQRERYFRAVDQGTISQREVGLAWFLFTSTIPVAILQASWNALDETQRELRMFEEELADRMNAELNKHRAAEDGGDEGGESDD